LGGKVNFFGKLGSDIYGDDVIRQLNEEKFPDSGVVRTGSATALGMIMVEPGGMNYIAGFSGANMEFMPDDIDHVAFIDSLSNSSHLILQMEIPPETNRFAMEMAKDSGCRVVMNFAPYRPTLPAEVELMDLLVFNEVEASGFYGTEIRNAADVLEMGCQRREILGKVVITLGAEGAVAFTQDSAVHLPGKKVKAVDSTGAGDSFVGALVYYLSIGDDLVIAATKANRAAGVSVTRMGAMPSLPRAEELS
jgi:ribokinase